MPKTRAESVSPPARCLICQGQTIEAHLIPRAFVREIQVNPKSGEQHIVVEYDRGAKRRSKTGLFSREILCAACDGRLGAYEDDALKLFRRLRSRDIGKKIGASSFIREGAYPFRVRRTDDLIRFTCGILWKYGAVPSTTPGHISLGPWKEVLAAICFQDGPIPESVDVAIERDLTSFAAFTDPHDVYYYRTPSMGVLGGRRMAWFSLGGFIIFVRLDAAGRSNHFPPRLWMRGRTQHHFWVAMRSLDENMDVGVSIHRVADDLAKLNATVLARHR